MIFLGAELSVLAQTVATTANVLHPIMKDPSKRNAISSLDRDPSEKADFTSPTPAAHRPQTQAAQPNAPAKPSEIIAQIDAGLAASPISLIGTINGIKGRLYVTNIGTRTVTPKVQFAVCDLKGFKIGATAKSGPALAPNEAAKIEVLATNADAVDLKLMKLSAGSGNK